MPQFSQRSLDRLSTVHPDLQTLFQIVIKYWDCSIVCGIRTEEEQKKLYAQGRTESGNIVTNADGVTNKSRHQSGNAVDVIPYPEGYDEEELHNFGYFVIGVATMLKSYGAIDKDVIWGGLWKSFSDKPHWEIK